MEINHKLTEKARKDYVLVCAALENGDQKAYAQLMNNYKDALYFIMLKMCNDANDADDLTIEAFGKAFKNLKQYTPDYAFSTWLFKIATNNCIDFIRKKKKNTLSINNSYETNGDYIGHNDMSHNIPSNTPDPEEKFIAKQKVHLMREVVDKLKPRYKRLVELRYFKEFSYEEISEELNLPLGTVKAQLFRARDFLYHILKNAQEKI